MKYRHLYKGNYKGLLFVRFHAIAHWSSVSRVRRFFFWPIWLSYRLLFNWLLGIDISEYTEIGSGFRLWHGVGTVVHPKVVIGNNVVMRSSTTIGTRRAGGGVPIIGDNCDIGANSVILGEISIGNNAIIGAGTVVLDDVPENAVVVGNPARIIKYVAAK